MVLFKRKPVQYTTAPIIEDDETEVWEIQQTGEIFDRYEAYLERLEFYQQRRFICQITGHSGLDFFEALKSETAGAKEVEQAFPEALKGPILRRVQFQTISRIDNLVDLIFDEFRGDYYPGEAVTVHVVTGEKLTGIVRDKTRFGSKPLPDGTLSLPFSRYFVSLDNRPTEEAVVDDAHIYRDRKIFTKQVLRSFIKKTVTRDAWTGAPWLVKHDVANLYHIDTRVPPHLRLENKVLERKQNQAQKKHAPDYDGMMGSFPGNGQAKLPELKPAPKSHKSKQAQAQPTKTKQPMFLNPTVGDPNSPSFQFPPNMHPNQFINNNFIPGQNNGQYYTTFHTSQMPHQPPPMAMPAPPPLPPPIKYPIEDLFVAPIHQAKPRPLLKYLSQDTPVEVKDHPAAGNGILMESIGPLLETWDTLNVYCEIFKLDSFTFDDFVEAMQFTSEDTECELFVEVHCATLKLLVNHENDDGKVQIQLPELDEESEDEEEEEETSVVPTPTPEPEPKPKGRTTRSSLAKSEAAELKKEPTPEPEEPKLLHRAAEMQADGEDWIDRLRKRDFRDGGWQIIMVGLLHQLSKSPRHEEPCEELLQELAPVDMEPTQETARIRYASLDINLRIRALQIVCMLTAQTKAIRGYMEECSEQMTMFRKEKIQYQRDRKIALEELRALNEERKILLPANTIPSPEPDLSKLKVNSDDKPNGEETEEVEDEVMDTDDEAHKGRSLRRGNDRAAERQRKRELELEERRKAEAAAKLPKQSKQFTKLLKEIDKKQDLIKQCEEEIAVLDNDLREADCPRTRCLGKDRFWNRYYWFERNGMPYGGLPNSSTAEADYANGCLWVQGPDEMEREGYIDMKTEWQEEYKQKFNMTVPERKTLEEGPTSVFHAREWGYFDNPSDVDGLIDWLDTRGSNELKLKKELQTFRDKIVENMEKRKEYLDTSKEEGKRMNTRKHAETRGWRCLAWHNTMALEDLGHLHCEQPRNRKGKKDRKRTR